MKKIRLVVEKREVSGSKASGRLRRSGYIPAVVYGHSGVKQLQILTPEFRKMMLEKGEGVAFIELVCGDETTLAMLQAEQRDPRKDNYLHLDFKEIAADRPMLANVPLRFIGEPIGVKEGGGLLDIARHTVAVSCLPDSLPEFIELDISGLNLGASIHTKNLPTLKGITYKTPADDVVVACVKVEDDGEEVTEEAAESDKK